MNLKMLLLSANYSNRPNIAGVWVLPEVTKSLFGIK
jgi:hypothetical protein